MPDHTELRVGDRIRLLAVPECDLRQREREIATNAEMAGWTADTIERIIAFDPVVTGQDQPVLNSQRVSLLVLSPPWATL
jgi:hypothetical protein